MREKYVCRGAIFDMDGTLVDSLMIWDVLWEKFGQRFLGISGFRPSEEADKAVRTMRFEHATEYIHNTYGMGRDGKEVFLAAEQLVADFYQNDVKVKKGVIPFLDACRRAKIPLCVASGTAHGWLETALSVTGLAPYCDHILSCDDVGVGKDRPDIYELALKKLGTNCGLFICNLGTGNGYSVLDVLHAYEKACGKTLPYVIDPRRPGDIAECYAEPKKAFEEMGWKAERGIEEMCASSWKWQSSNPNGYNA
jgi:beta-phosphoglucomutase-like phosphatase (HAD superfamily)